MHIACKIAAGFGLGLLAAQVLAQTPANSPDWPQLARYRAENAGSLRSTPQEAVLEGLKEGMSWVDLTTSNTISAC